MLGGSEQDHQNENELFLFALKGNSMEVLIQAALLSQENLDVFLTIDSCLSCTFAAVQRSRANGGRKACIIIT